MSNRVGDWMQTRSGAPFWPLDPRPSEVDLDDIAHALSHLCRFGGHCREFYSVAQHSVLVGRILLGSPRVGNPDEYSTERRHNALTGLMHDAAEAYVVDVPRPLKYAMPNYIDIEDRVCDVIFQKYGIRPIDKRVKWADNVALVTEARDLMGNPSWLSTFDEIPLEERVVPWSSAVAREEFLKMFNQLCEGLTRDA